MKFSGSFLIVATPPLVMIFVVTPGFARDIFSDKNTDKRNSTISVKFSYDHKCKPYMFHIHHFIW